MSVQKTITFEETPYTQVYTHVIQNINNLEAGFIWIYLLSKPKDWDVIKEHLKNKFSIGDDKLKKIFAYLKLHNLITYITHRNSKGRIIEIETRILNGSKFITDQELIELSTKEIKKHPSTGVIIHPVASHTCGFGGLQIPDTTNKRKNTKKRETLKKSFCPETQDLIISEEAVKIANDKKLDITKIGYAFMKYAESNGWLRTDWKAAFLKWVIDEKKPVQCKTVNESHSTVQFWGPGHPTWDSLHGKTYS